MNSKDRKNLEYQRKRREKLGRTNHAWLTDEEAELIAQYRQARNCAHKRHFETETEALRGAIEQTAKIGGTPVRHYQCPICGGFHLTSQAERKEDAP